MCFSFAEFEKNISFKVLTLGAIGAKTRFFKMWPKSMQDQKFDIFLAYNLKTDNTVQMRPKNAKSVR